MVVPSLLTEQILFVDYREIHITLQASHEKGPRKRNQDENGQKMQGIKFHLLHVEVDVPEDPVPSGGVWEPGRSRHPDVNTFCDTTPFCRRNKGFLCW